MFFQNSANPVCPLVIKLAMGAFLTSIGTTALAGGTDEGSTVPGTAYEMLCLIRSGSLGALDDDFLRHSRTTRFGYDQCMMKTFKHSSPGINIESYLIKEEYSASLSLMLMMGTGSVSSVGCCLLGLTMDSACGAAGAVVALTLGASMVGLNMSAPGREDPCVLSIEGAGKVGRLDFAASD